MATDFVSGAVVAGTDATAAQYNNLRTDTIRRAGDYATAGGTGDVITLAIDASIAAYTAGQVFKFKAAAANTGSATLNVNSIGAKTIKKNNDQNLVANDIENGQIVEVVYDGTSMLMLSQLGNDRSPKVSIDATDVTYTASVTETTLVTFSIPAYTLGTANAVKVEVPITDLDILNDTNLTIRLKYGATTVATAIIGNQDSGAASSAFTNWSGKIEAWLFGTGATNTQEGSIAIQAGAALTLPNLNHGTILQDVVAGTAAENSTTALNLVITAQWDVNNAANSITIPHYIMTKIQV